MLWIVRLRLYPATQLRLMHAQVLRGLRIRDPAVLDQPHRLKLELACKLPSLHDPPPVPLKHLTRCLRNRVQAIPWVLEAAHITPYMGASTNSLLNGLLLRADIHTLFNLGLISIDPDR